MSNDLSEADGTVSTHPEGSLEKTSNYLSLENSALDTDKNRNDQVKFHDVDLKKLDEESEDPFEISLKSKNEKDKDKAEIDEPFEDPKTDEDDLPYEKKDDDE